MLPPFIACDFDGTITERDTAHVIVDAFGRPGLWDEIEPRLMSGQITIEQAMAEEFAAVRATPDQVREVVLRDAPIRGGFADFVAWTRAHGARLVVVSAGFRSVIGYSLAAAGITGLEVRANEISFTPNGSRVIWSERGPACDLCGRACKRHDIALRRRLGERLVYIGDGISDRCASLMSDLVFARAGLADYLAGQGFPYVPFEDFRDVIAHLERTESVARVAS